MTLEQELNYLFAAQVMKIFTRFPDYKDFHPRVFSILSGNPIITIEYVNAHPTEPWSWQGLTFNPSISLAYMEMHPEKPWNIHEYELRKYGGEAPPTTMPPATPLTPFPPSRWNARNITLEYIEAQMDWIDMQTANDEDCSIWSEISENPNLTLAFIEKYLSKPWDFYVLTGNELPIAKAQFRKEYLAACKY